MTRMEVYQGEPIHRSISAARQHWLDRPPGPGHVLLPAAPAGQSQPTAAYKAAQCEKARHGARPVSRGHGGIAEHLATAAAAATVCQFFTRVSSLVLMRVGRTRQTERVLRGAHPFFAQDVSSTMVELSWRKELRIMCGTFVSQRILQPQSETPILPAQLGRPHHWMPSHPACFENAIVGWACRCETRRPANC